MTAVEQEIHQYPFNSAEGLDLDPAYQRARATDGLIRVQLPYGEPAWLATRYDDVRLVLGDKRFSRAAAVERDNPRNSAGRNTSGILSMDPPDHTRLRVLVAKAFTVRRVERLRPWVEQIADKLIDDLIAGDRPADLVDAFALPLPVQVICELLGVPVEDRHLFRDWSDKLLSTSGLTAEEFDGNREEIRDYMAGLIALRRAEPADDLMTALIEARAEDTERLTELELIDLCVGVLVAGHETTATMIPNIMHVLLANPERLAELQADPELVPAAIEELLRFIPLGIGGGQARYATEDVEVGGTLVRAGEPVLTANGSANRDAAKFENPEELDFHRKGNSHVGFGHGVHHCLGAPLARLEMQVALRALITRLPGMRLAEPPEWKTKLVVRGPRRMPVEW